MGSQKIYFLKHKKITFYCAEWVKLLLPLEDACWQGHKNKEGKKQLYSLGIHLQYETTLVVTSIDFSRQTCAPRSAKLGLAAG